VNSDVYQFAAVVLQTSQAYDITIDGNHKYNVPSGNITIDQPSLDQSGATSLTSYAQAAIAGADDFNDDDTTIKDLFDIIVGITREVTPTCKISIIRSYHPLTEQSRIKSEPP